MQANVDEVISYYYNFSFTFHGLSLFFSSRRARLEVVRSDRNDVLNWKAAQVAFQFSRSFVRALSKKSSWRKREEEKKWRQSNDQNQEEEEVAIGERPAEGRQFVKINQQTFFDFQSFLFEKLRFVVVVCN